MSNETYNGWSNCETFQAGSSRARVLAEFDNAQSCALKSYSDAERYARIEERAPCNTDGAQWVAPLRVTFGWVEDIGIDSGARRYFDRWTEATQCCANWMGGEL